MQFHLKKVSIQGEIYQVTKSFYELNIQPARTDIKVQKYQSNYNKTLISLSGITTGKEIAIILKTSFYIQ